jgi:hypothetical protein
MFRFSMAIAAFVAALATRTGAASPAAPLFVPFTYVHHELLVAVRIGSAGPYAFMLDTDTTPSVIVSPAFDQRRFTVVSP